MSKSNIKFPSTKFEFLALIIVFFDIFDRPVTFDEVSLFFSDFDFDIKDISDVSNYFPQIKFDGNLFYISSRSEIVSNYEYNTKFYKKFKKKSERFLSLLKFIPFVDAVSLCNNMGFKSVTKDSDIDLFIITDPKRIFTARILVTLLFHFLKLRRHSNKIAGRFCLSFFVSNPKFSLAKISIPNDYYLFFWGRYLDPIFGFKYFNKFFESNFDFLNFRMNLNTDFDKEKKSFIKLIFEKLLYFRFGDFIENKLCRWHEKRLFLNRQKFNKNSDVIVSKEMLKFHNFDRRKYYSDLLLSKLDEYDFTFFSDLLE